MKKLILVAMLLVLILSAVPVTPVLGAGEADLVGRVTVPGNDPYPNFAGDLALDQNGTITGTWRWEVFNFCNSDVTFHCQSASSLSFQDEKTAVFTGTFVCHDLPIILYSPEGVSCELTFVVTEGTKDKNYNPGRLLAALPIDAHLPLGFDYGLGRGKMLVYNADGVLLFNHDGNYKVTVYDR